jgi:hypothetical protein
MAKMKFDGLIEAVRYAPDGNIELVRAYERRGATFSDIILIDRSNLITRLKNGQKFVTGTRQEFLGSTFDTTRVVQLNGDVITTLGSANRGNNSRDLLEEVPSI